MLKDFFDLQYFADEQSEKTGDQDDQNKSSSQEEEDKKIDEDKFPRSYVEKLRQESAGLRTELKKFKEEQEAERLKQLEEQGKFKEMWEKSETEKKELDLKLKEMEAENLKRQQHSYLMDLAKKANFIKPEQIRFMDISDFEFSDGKFIGPEAIETRLEKFIKENQHLINANQGPGDSMSGVNSSKNQDAKYLYVKYKDVKEGGTAFYSKMKEQAEKAGKILKITE